MRTQIQQYCRELDALADFNRHHRELKPTLVERREEANKRTAIAARAHELALTILSLGSEDNIREFAKLLSDERYRAHVAIRISDARQENNSRISDDVRARSKDIVLEVLAEDARRGNLLFDQAEPSTKP